MYDSVFSQFSQIPYPDDRPVTPEREILRELEGIEKKGAIAIHKVMSQLAPTLTSEEALKEGRKKAQALLQKVFYSVWLAGWGSGGKRATEEIKQLTKKFGIDNSEFGIEVRSIIPNSEFRTPNSFAMFRRKDNTERASIRNVAAERAIRQRTNKLADDVTDSEFKRIQKHLLAAVTPQPDTGNPISREELLKRIDAELGASSQRFANRAERIARTELTFAYNAGRLDTYRQSGVVAAVSYFCITDERTCFPSGTLVTTDQGDKPIETIKPGDLILTRFGYRPCRAVMKRPYSGKMTRLKTTDGREVTSTSNHPFWTSQGWREAGTLNIGDELQTFANKRVNIQSLVNFSFGDTNNSPSLLSQKCVLPGIPIGVSMPVLPIHLQCDIPVTDSEIDGISADLELLDEFNPQSFKSLSDSSFKPSFPIKLSVTREGAKNRIKARDISEEFLAVFAGSDMRGASASLRAISSSTFATLRWLVVKLLAASFAIDINDTLAPTFDAANLESIFYRLQHGKSGVANIADLVDSFHGFLAGQVARLRANFPVPHPTLVNKEVIAALADFLSCNLSAINRAEKPVSFLSGAAFFDPNKKNFLATKALPFLGRGLGFTSPVKFVALTGAELFPFCFNVSESPTKSAINYHSKPRNDNSLLTVYNLEVEQHHEYFANGILVHNCNICLPRNGLMISLDDAKAIASNSPPLHPLCRCLLSPVLDGDPRLKDKNRRPDRRQLVAAPPAWMAAAILAAVLLGSVTLAGGKVKQATDAVETIGTVAGGLVAAEALGQIAKATGEQPENSELESTLIPNSELRIPNSPLPPSPLAAQVAVSEVARIPSVMIGAINLNTATFDELRSLLPRRLFTDAQINSILGERDANGYFDSIEDLRNRVRGIGQKTQERLVGLSEGSDIFIFLDPDNVRTPAQLWASNLGLTKAQARTIFEEMQRASFKDFEDLKRRLKGRGIGDKTIENMQQRATIRQRITQQLRQQVRQGVGENSELIIRNSELQRISTPNSELRIPNLPPPSLPPRPPAPTIDPLLNAKADSIETAVQGFNDSIPRAFDAQANKRTILGKNFNQIASEQEAALNGLQQKYDAIASNLNKTGSQLDAFERRIAGVEGDLERLLDPQSGNYFENNYTELISIRSGLNQASRKLPSLPGANDLKSLNAATTRLERELSKLGNSSGINNLRSAQEGLRSNIAEAVRELQNQEAKFLRDKIVPPPELQRLKEKYQRLQDQLQDVDDYLDNQFASKIDAARRLDPLKNDLQEAIASTNDRIEQLRDRFSKLPLTKADLDPTTRTKYEALVDLRRTQRSFREGTQKFRQARAAVERNLNNRDAAQQQFYEGYDRFRGSFEQSNSPLIQRQLTQLTSDLEALEAMPKGRVAWLLSFNGYDFSGIPDDLASSVRGLPQETGATRLQALARDIGNRLGRVKGAIASVENNAQFKYPITQGGRRTVYDQASALSRAEAELKYWEELRNRNLNPDNIGSSKNRLSSLDRADATPDDTLGYARSVLTDLDQWNQKYATLKEQSTLGGLEAIDQLQERFGQAQENFLSELGETRVQQSQIIERAYQDARDIYERIRSDASKVPVFDLNGQAIPQNQLLEQLKGYSQRVEALRQLREIPTLPTPADASQLPIIQTLNTQRQAIASQLDDAVRERDRISQELLALQEQGRGTKRKQQELDRAGTRVNELSQQEAGLATEMGDRSLPTNQYNQLQELQSQLVEARANLASLQSQLSEANREVSNLAENVQRVSGQARERMLKGLDAATSRRERLSNSVTAAAGRINAINGQIGAIRSGG